MEWATQLQAGNKPGTGRVAAAMRHLQFATALIPLTNGYRVKNRHLGQAMNTEWGPLQTFMTINLADNYNHIVLHLYNSEQKIEESALRITSLSNLACAEPAMPSLKQMRAMCADTPRSGAKFWLLMEDLVLRHLLGISSAYLGNWKLSSPLCRDVLVQEDDYASSG